MVTFLRPCCSSIRVARVTAPPGWTCQKHSSGAKRLDGLLWTWRGGGSAPSWSRAEFRPCVCELFSTCALQGQCTAMSLTWPSSKCRRTIVWRSSRGSGGTAANVPRKRTTGPQVWFFLLQSHPSSSSCFHTISPPLFLPRPGHGEHRRHLCGAGVRPASGHLNGGAGVCMDVEAEPWKRGEPDPSNLHLLCLSVPSLAPAPSRSYQAFQLPALTGEATLPPSVKPERNNQHKAKDVPHIYLRVHTQNFPHFQQQKLYKRCS